MVLADCLARQDIVVANSSWQGFTDKYFETAEYRIFGKNRIFGKLLNIRQITEYSVSAEYLRLMPNTIRPNIGPNIWPNTSAEYIFGGILLSIASNPVSVCIP